MEISYTTTAYKAGSTTAAAPAKAKTAADTKIVLQQTVDTLKLSTSALNEQKKSMAADRVDQVKEKLKALRAVSGLDAKGTARIAANLTKELAYAVKDYTSASGPKASAGPAATPVADNNDDAAGLNDIEPGADSGQTTTTYTFNAATSLYTKTQTATAAAIKDDGGDKDFLKNATALHRSLKSLVELQSARIKADRPIFSFFATSSLTGAGRDLDQIEQNLAKIS